LTGKTRLSEMTCVDGDVKSYSFTHSLIDKIPSPYTRKLLSPCSIAKRHYTAHSGLIPTLLNDTNEGNLNHSAFMIDETLQHVKRR